MRYLVLATDYDGVVAAHGRASDDALAALGRLRTSGRRALLVTGRTVPSLREACPDLTVFDRVVAENGAVVYDPHRREEIPLASPPPAEFVERLRALGVEPLELGRVIVATRLPHQVRVLQAIQELGLELHIIFNREAVMVLPAGVNKATGMLHVLRTLGLSPHEVLAVGDSENDHSFLQRSECAVTVANAVPSVRRIAAVVARGANGTGLAELIDDLVATDFARLQGRLPQHLVTFGRRTDGTPVTVPPYGPNLLVCGPSGSGKSTIAAGIAERLIQQAYQVCIVDPEGDYGALSDVVALGHRGHAVGVQEVLAMLEDPTLNLNVNLLGIPLADRPTFFGELLPHLQALRTRTGRPHWIVLDEAHHLLPAEWGGLSRALPHALGETLLVTVHPEHLAPLALARVDVAVAVGRGRRRTLQAFADAVGRPLPWSAALDDAGEAVVWFTRGEEPPFVIDVLPSRTERIRHRRKYAEGDMHHHSFYFRGPGGRHNLRAQNLAIFSQIADGIDEETWLYHLRRGDYSRWFRDAVKDRYLADQAERVEQRRELSPAETRHLIASLIESRYTLPA